MQCMQDTRHVTCLQSLNTVLIYYQHKMPASSPGSLGGCVHTSTKTAHGLSDHIITFLVYSSHRAQEPPRHLKRPFHRLAIVSRNYVMNEVLNQFGVRPFAGLFCCESKFLPSLDIIYHF